MRSDTYQILLIAAGFAVSALFGVFLYREMFPEYKIYQNDYIALEEFRSTYTHEPPPPFQTGVKQIVIEREDKGPPTIDRCISCHVALQIPDFSPTKIARDPNGGLMRNSEGTPLQVPNDAYIWKKLDEKIAALRDGKVLEQLKSQGREDEIKSRPDEAAKYEALKTARVGGRIFDVEKVLVMHPLMGNETYPFQYHPIEEYGCTSCHNGNGRGLTTDKAHGPVFDGQYEVEDLGHTFNSTESDPKNDPRFSHIFNGKPGSDLIFQTEPIYVGALIQAKCVQCHKAQDIKFPGIDQGATVGGQITKEEGKNKSNVFSLTRNFQRGKELFISQACYACHRISTFSRGGVGPELTKAGESYPWFLKKKLVWPQGDLATSTMPNMHLDSHEIEDLMAFLLSLKGNSRAVSKTDYQAAVQSWEAGAKMNWEKPVPPSLMDDLRHSMTLYATQGCAACHRLQGFESNVGFAVEKENPTFDQLYEEKLWFKKLFPEVVHYSYYSFDEELPGSEIVAAIEKQAEEIDKRIIPDARQNSLLEEIEQNYPGLLESLYSPFRYASRAKNHHYEDLISKEKDPLKALQLKEESLLWKERVRRILMTYIQIYGLGRLIGPHLNWSGIYRSDEWLMEHFKNPPSHVPRSIMPVFPFDETKFYALTRMLDALAVTNRNAVRQIFEHRGFDPHETFDMLCSQCHGIAMTGNGVLAEWIYPIPKNLRNPEFLRNLTKEKAVYSIHHGVLGTPMPPWGQAAPKSIADGKNSNPATPVLKESEIRYLVDWIYSALPGGDAARASDVFKWKYSPEDVLKELENEGGKLIPQTFEKKSEESPSRLSASSFEFPQGHPQSSSQAPRLFASLDKFPTLGAPSKEAPARDGNPVKVEDIFDIVANQTDTGDQSYYIKKKFYTSYNIEQGEKFFLLNCAACHGSEADGSGVRASAMSGAKPRILTNLDWINSRDDLRLLRSIKFGVPGTGMTPWGDLTNSEQRLQLVIFIRSLKVEQEKRSRLLRSLYEAFESAQVIVENARIDGSSMQQMLQKKINELTSLLSDLENSLAEGRGNEEEALRIYRQRLDTNNKIQKVEEVDGQLVAIKGMIKKTYELYYQLGSSLINKGASDEIFENFLHLIDLNAGLFAIEDHRLKLHELKKESMLGIQKKIVQEMDNNIAELEKTRKVIEGKISTPQQKEDLAKNFAEIESEKNLRDKIVEGIVEAQRIFEEEKETVGALRINF